MFVPGRIPMHFSTSDHSEVGHSEANCFEIEAKRASPVPSREASEDCSGVAYDGEIPDQGCFDSCQEQIDESTTE